VHELGVAQRLEVERQRVGRDAEPRRQVTGGYALGPCLDENAEQLEAARLGERAERGHRGR